MALVATGIICAAIAYVSYTAWALTGFGSAIIFQILWYFISLFYGSGDIVDGLLYLSIAGVAVMPYQAVLLRKHINWKLVGVMLIGFIPFLFVGINVLLIVTSPWLKRSLGFLFLLQWFKMVYDQRQHELKNLQKHDSGETFTAKPQETIVPAKSQHDTLETAENPLTTVASTTVIEGKVELVGFRFKTWRDVLILLCVTSFAGFLGGMFGTAGPPYMVWLTYNRHVNKDIWRASAATMSSFYILPRIIYLLYASGRYNANFIPIYVATMLAGICATLAANKFLNKFVDPVAFRRLILLFLLLGSLLLITSGLQQLSRYFALTVVGIFVTFALIYAARRKCGNAAPKTYT